MQNQTAASPASNEPVNTVQMLAETFPGSKCTYEQLQKWRKMPGWKPDNDPFLNGMIKGKEPPSPEDDDEPKRTPEFELSRMLDECMREVYKHLHDAFTDKTCDGQELYLGRAYRTITQFQMDHSGKLSKVQSASIAVTRDQVAKFQVDLAESKPNPLSIPMDLLEKSFARMNQWRPDDDPMRTMALSQYVDKEKREAHAKAVAAKPPPQPVKKALASGIEVSVTEVIAQIEALARMNKGFGDKGLFFGVNYTTLCRNGDVMPGERIIDCKTEEQWKALEPSFAAMQLVASGQKLPGEQSYFTELTDVRHDGLQLVVQYFVIELDDRRHENTKHNDTRAQLLPEVLSGKTFHGDAIVQVWAHIKQLNAVDKDRKEVGEAHEEHDVPEPCPSPNRIRPPKDGRRGSGDLFANVDSEDDLVDNSMAKGGVSTLRHEASKLMERARAVAELGDHKSAYEFAAQAHALRTQADSVEADVGNTASASPVGNEPNVYKPEVKYEYPSGEVRIIEAGYYSESEHLAKSMYEQDLLTAVRTATAAGVASAKLTPDQMSKYEAPLIRSESQAEAMTSAEKLSETIRDKAERARNVMSASREGSKQASPQQSPKLAASTPPEGAISFKLPEDLVSAAERELAQSLPQPKSLQPGSHLFAPSREAVLQPLVYGAPPDAPDAPTMDELAMTDAERDYHDFS
jgi:hypothetical protein